MEAGIKPTLIHSKSLSLIEFLLGDGMQPGWLDTQSHHCFARVPLNCPGYPSSSRWYLHQPCPRLFPGSVSV